MSAKGELPLLNRAVRHFDAVIVGAGIAGLWMLHRLRQLGLSVHAYEGGDDVGGTWFWNRYPGARTDSEAWYYLDFFPEDSRGEWAWRDRYPTQAECLEYLQHAADRLDLRRDIQFGTRVASAIYNESANLWTVTTSEDEAVTCRYFITATGVLSEAYEPPFPGVENFRGEWYLTARWPRKTVDFTGKRVAVIGTGASGVQAIPLIAQQCQHLTVFQRTPNYVIPARNHPLDDAHRVVARRDYAATWAKAHNHFFGMPFEPANRLVAEVAPAEAQRILEAAWEAGGFRFVFETFDDTLVDAAANETVAEFVRNKIRSIVKDPDTAELLAPKGYPIVGKRPPLGHSYYETFNRNNVTLVDVSGNPIEEVTPTGLRTGTDDYQFDVIVCATGFDAASGPLLQLDIRGRDGETLRNKWADGAKTYLGLSVDGFPNMFLICGPGTPFANIPTVIEQNVGWVVRALSYKHDHRYSRMEARPSAVNDWTKSLNEAVKATVLAQGDKVNSWFLGANIPGKPREVLFYFGGTGVYGDIIKEVADNDFEGFEAS